MAERRWTTRNTAYLGARVYFNKGYSSRDCIVRNVSGGGVMLEMESVAGIPEEFEVHLLERNKRLPANRIWRTWNRLGVSYVKEPVPAEIISLADVKIRELAAENAALKDQLASRRKGD